MANEIFIWIFPDDRNPETVTDQGSENAVWGLVLQMNSRILWRQEQQTLQLH